MNDVQVPRPEQAAAAPPPARPADPLGVDAGDPRARRPAVRLDADRRPADALYQRRQRRAFVVRARRRSRAKSSRSAVRDNQIVRTGDLLYRIDPTPFRIAVERAEAKLVAAGQAVGASTAAVDEAQAQLCKRSHNGTMPANRRRASSRCARGGLFAGTRRPARSSWTRREAQVAASRPHWSRHARSSAPRAPTTHRSARHWPRSNRRAWTLPARR